MGTGSELIPLLYSQLVGNETQQWVPLRSSRPTVNCTHGASLDFDCYQIMVLGNGHTHAQFSPHFNGHFPGGPGLAGTRMSPFWILLKLRMMEVVVTTAAIKRAKLQSNRNRKQTDIQLCTVLIWKYSGHVELVIVNLMPSSHCITRWPHTRY